MLFWQEKPAFGLTSKDVNVLTNAQEYRTQLLRLISNAKKRIYITALYLQDDEAGREILEALHRVSLANPNLEIKVLVDFHRAQRGLIGAKKSDGNASLYCDYLEKFKSNVQVYGVPVKAKELFGVLHLKGFVVDDTLLYSGASLNNVYLQYNERYRLDRYFLVDQAALCDSVVDFIESKLIGSQAVPRIDTRPLKRLIDFKFEQKQLMRELKSASYANPTTPNTDPLGVRLFLGLGRRNNSLNRLIKNLFDTTEQELVLYTPYFNFPAPLMRSLRRLLKQGKQVTIVVGDKTANDFYLPPSEPFSKIGALPYLYETILHKFVKSQKRHIDNGNLNVYLWKHESNSFHLKGICADRQRHLLSGHNLNPRAWGLDIENGILIEDPQQSIMQAIDNEKQEILKHCRRLTGPNDLETVENYPQPVKKLLGQAKRVKVDFIIKRFI
ncbi:MULTISPECIES: CDP-diacylglycerol--serine O-phosphatidyltransferase [Pseudoalteromonas]|jgi:CDP-diacylglycerol--serine O-phosphatidyltransferase|uniref:CDP-diacylglycerol---serine O-phosphatidyltransferase n=2 Tax=Pseudoalteromonas TaxID=53246 RepID=A0ACA8DWJ6_9GAMM|nr:MULTISPECIES: CDP-diacylglycerol--serine O-phosphatidyltransferase [Pseudoalteromonas]MAJ38950.1 phosphatidylserine synthase [Pseudoalteromonadaceae bacterium]MDY6886989.1 CDP-diacylglycerol--serine O-phosphatidyltransferase [Pseudomonadota bacterium]OUX92190.1 MAG: phosphatidylserine synthase [Pseudoalteromonas sp. TMED43]GEK77994.1 CDP-diacylglycerol--serine O-phosphatidyltransferase [Pseudoalteromonas atlantica]ATC82125.1 CDP-diacylglycerol---serine O-phosphatidyltransferase [Pseudoalter|tara:strand:+ start:1487 stop:2812 length:1326 start_codon:yes stop_codon:yes gene_type:complete